MCVLSEYWKIPYGYVHFLGIYKTQANTLCFEEDSRICRVSGVKNSSISVHKTSVLGFKR